MFIWGIHMFIENNSHKIWNISQITDYHGSSFSPNDSHLSWIHFGAITVDGQKNIQTQHALRWTTTAPNQCFSAPVTKSDFLGVWFLSSIGANALQVTWTLKFGGEGVLLDRRGLNISSIYGSYPVVALCQYLAWLFHWSEKCGPVHIPCRECAISSTKFLKCDGKLGSSYSSCLTKDCHILWMLSAHRTQADSFKQQYG